MKRASGGANRPERPEAVPAHALPYLEEQPQAAGGSEDTFRLAVRNPRAGDGLRDGDLLVVNRENDAEPGDLVVWWTGSKRSMALARMETSLTLRPVAGFPAPPVDGGRPPRVRGIVIATERPRRKAADQGV